jgi:CheY-like chemotaxis protein
MATKKILLVDDDKDFIAAQGAMLKHAGYEVFFAHSGSEGFLKAKEVMPDLIILDVNMESFNAGFDLNRQIRKDKNLLNIPIIMLTGIETYPISSHILDMYNAMKEKGEVDLYEVLKVADSSDDVGVQYRDDSGNPFYLPLDSFVSKDNVDFRLMQEIERFTKR